jgi:hypothetical protein
MTRSTFLAVAAVSLLALPAVTWAQSPAPPVAAPAAAPAAPTVAWTLDVRGDWLVGRVHRALDEHDIDADEADRVYKEVAGLRAHLKLIASRHTVTSAENAAHEAHLDTVVSTIHWLRADAFQRPW